MAASKGAQSKGADEHKRKSATKLGFIERFGLGLAPLDLNSQQFRFTALRPQGNTRLDDYIESVEWRDEGNQFNLNTIPILQGTLNYRKPDADMPGGGLRIEDGHRIRCEVYWFGKWSPLWEMRLTAPPQVSIADGTTTVELADDLALASQTTSATMHFGKLPKKGRPHGWRYDEIVRRVAKAYRIPLGSLVKGTTWIALDPGDTSGVTPLEIIRQAVTREAEQTGRVLVIGWRPNAKGRFGLSVFEAKRNTVLYEFRNQIIEATVANLRRGAGTFATAIIARGTRKGTHGRRIKLKPVKVVDAAAVRQYGYIERKVTVPGHVSGHGELSKRAREILHKNLTPIRVIQSFEHPGIAFVRRGDAIDIVIPEEGFVGRKGVMFVTSVTHSLSAGVYTMSMEMTWNDLFARTLKSARDAKKRADKRKHKSKHKES